MDIQIERVRRTAAERGVDLEVESEARAALVEAGYDPAFGARPLRRVLQRRLLDPLALGLLDGRFGVGDRVVARARDGEVVLESATIHA